MRILFALACLYVAFSTASNTSAEVPGIAPQSYTTFSELVKQEEKLRFAHELTAQFKAFIADPKVAEKEKELATERLAHWEKLAETKSQKYGRKWRTTDEIASLKKETNALIESASKLIEVGSNAVARDNLLKASRIDPEGVRADFTLGLAHALLAHSPKSARKHFIVCVRRLSKLGNYRSTVQQANLISAMNNAAITETRLRSYGSALKRWRQLLEVTDPSPEVIQNLGRFSELSGRCPYLSVSKSTTKSVGKLYGMVAARHSTKPYDRTAGWLYIPYISEKVKDDLKQPETPQDNPERIPLRKLTNSTRNLREFAQGSGFVIADGMIITNKHVAEDAVAFRFKIDGKDMDGKLGHTHAISSKWDLAIIAVPGLSLPSIPIATEKPRIGVELRVLGYPQASDLGDYLKVTSGTYAGPMTDGHMLYDAVTNPGNSGGPVINQNGEVIAVHTLGINFSAKYAGGVPGLEALAFVQKHKMLLANNQNAIADDADWLDVIEKAGKSTVQILCLTTPDKIHWAGRKRPNNPDDTKKVVTPRGWNGLEDPWCMNCNGVAHVDCPNRKCRVGVIVGRKQVTIPIPGGNDRTKTVPTRSRCPTCSGRGQVSCPHCNNGLDSTLSN